MNANPSAHRPRSLALAWLTLAFGVFVYFHNLGSEHASNNPDELLYWQITRLTAESSHWLPLQGHEEGDVNTKPPALFWQGIVSTDWARNWTIWNLRYPMVLYTLATALMVFLLGKKFGRNTYTGLLAATIYLAFFGTYRYGRVFLTSAPETFWLFLPIFVVLYWRSHPGALSWGIALAFGAALGVGLLYKSFALVIPAALALAWLTLHLRGYAPGRWFAADLPKIAVLSALALGVFSLWFLLDPAPGDVFRAFVLRENVGKFDPRAGNYLTNFFIGGSSIWRMLAAYPINAGLLALVVVALFVVALRNRRSLPAHEQLLWIWILTLLVFFLLPDKRDERYLLPGMPALAVLCALHWSAIPRWTFTPALFAAAVIALLMAVGGWALQAQLAAGGLYSWVFWFGVVATVAVAAAGILRSALTRTMICPAVFLLYFCFAGFLQPFDGPLGEYDEVSVAFARSNNVAIPTRYGARDEIYRFMLPGGKLQHVYSRNLGDVAQLAAEHDSFIFTTPAGDLEALQGAHVKVIGVRLSFEDRFGKTETEEMLRGRIMPHLFKQDWLLQSVRPKEPGD